MKTQRPINRPRLTGLVTLSLLALLPSAAHAQETPTAPRPGVDAVSPPTAPAEPAPATPAPAAPGSGAEATPGVMPAGADPAPATAPPTSVPADAAASAPSTVDAEAAAVAAALEQEIAKEAADTDDYKLDIYGFADFTYGMAVKKFAFGPPYNSFAVGNLNVYLASDLGDSWRSLAEVRFTYLPHGVNQVNPATGAVTRIDTTSADYTDLGRPLRWGGISIERAHLEYIAHPLLTLRGGHFLTPYGIWNVDHGSPVIVGVRRPFIVGEALLPESQTGLEIYGTHHFDPIQVGYHLTLSNGRGPIDTYQDLNSNTALGGRLFARADTGAGDFTLGVSGYTGRYTDRAQTFAIDPNGQLSVDYPITLDYNERSFAADVKWELEGFLLQSEAIMNDMVYDDVRPADPFAIGGPPGYLTDVRRVGVYGLAGYRFAFGGIMPFAGLEYYDAGRAGFGGEAAAFWGGLNVRPTPRVVLKGQYTYSWFPGDPADIPEDSHYNSVDLQAAWSF